MKYFFLVCVVAPLLLHAQTEIKIGDRCDSLSLGKIMHYAAPTARVSDLKGKIIILDIGNIHCSSCVKGLPEIDSVQRLYKDKLQVFWVTPDPQKDVASFLSKSAIGRSICFPVVYEDSVLAKRFKHTFFPHLVWIDPDGIVRAFTYPEYVTGENVEKLFAQKTVDWAVKRELNYDYDQNMLVLNTKNISAISYPVSVSYSVFSGHLDGVPSRRQVTFDSARGMVTLHLINRSIIDLYTMPFRNSGHHEFEYMRSRVLLRVGDPDNVVFFTKGYRLDWEKVHTFCYELSYPVSLPVAIRDRKILEDLNFNLGLHGELVKRDMSCFLIVKGKEAAVVGPKPGRNKRTVVVGPAPEERICSIKEMVEEINDVFGNKPTFADTALLNRDIMVRFSDSAHTRVWDLPSLRELLLPYGLDVEEIVRPMTVLVLERL